MKRAIIIAAMLAAAGLAGAQMFAQLFGGEAWTPAALGPIAWYKAENNANDDSGSGYAATWFGSPGYADGKVGNAFSLDGATNYLATPTSVAGATSGGSFTLAMWIRPTKDFNTLPNGLSGESVFLKKSSGTGLDNYNAFSWKIDTDTDQIQLLVFNETGSVVVNSFASNTTWEAATWYHIAVKFDGAGYTFYLNGLQDGYMADSDGVGATTGHYILIGRDASADVPQFFNGCIDDVSIFNRALSAEEITKLYNESINKNGEAW